MFERPQYHIDTSLTSSVFQRSMTLGDSSAVVDRETIGSVGVEILKDFLNSKVSEEFVKKLVLRDEKLLKEYEKANFWSGQSFIIKGSTCQGIKAEGLEFEVACEIRGKSEIRKVIAPYSKPVTDETMLKRILVEMAVEAGRHQDTGSIASLPFGEDITIPIDLKFNNVPHATWVRSYLYDSVTTAIRNAVNDDTIPNKSRLQLKVNFPEVNPAFDTYRIGEINYNSRTNRL